MTGHVREAMGMLLNQDRLKHLSENERAALAEYIHRLVSAFPEEVQRVVLYGSKARGDFHAESDLDIFVVTESDDWRLHYHMADIAADVNLQYGVLIVDLSVGRTRFARMQELGEPLWKNIKAEGIVLWTRQPVLWPASA